MINYQRKIDVILSKYKKTLFAENELTLGDLSASLILNEKEKSKWSNPQFLDMLGIGVELQNHGLYYTFKYGEYSGDNYVQYISSLNLGVIWNFGIDDEGMEEDEDEIFYDIYNEFFCPLLALGMMSIVAIEIEKELNHHQIETSESFKILVFNDFEDVSNEKVKKVNLDLYVDKVIEEKDFKKVYESFIKDYFNDPNQEDNSVYNTLKKIIANHADHIGEYCIDVVRKYYK